ncbi:copper resistance CopC family protein [Halobacillus massiliensis]|uniref:copper resistance CopC family protein n=1 Tax=Halobacillus massiliensis TaxID=1926286 RepID=UPI0009E2A231|nr:copper resistance CopC family protein [Halobacillus massiliensis]
MKLKYMFFLILFIAFPLQAGAHTHLENSEPVQGETVTAENPLITLNFDSAVRDPNTIIVTDKNGEETTIEDINHSPENVIEITLPENLTSGEIELFYSIVGEDGHVMEEELPFTYEGLSEEEAAESEESAEERAAKMAEESQQEAEQETEKANNSASEEDTTGNSWLLPAIAVGLVALAVIAFLATRKKS